MGTRSPVLAATWKHSVITNPKSPLTVSHTAFQNLTAIYRARNVPGEDYSWRVIIEPISHVKFMVNILLKCQSYMTGQDSLNGKAFRLSRIYNKGFSNYSLPEVS